MAKDVYGVGIVSTAWVAGAHLTAFEALPNAKVVAVQSRDLSRAKSWIAQHGVQAKAYDDYEAMLQDPDIDIISICTPHPLHPQQTIAAAQAGKHIVIEKPVALNLEDMQAMRDAVQKAGVKTVVSFVLRWNPLFEIIQSLLADDTIGHIFLNEVDYLHGIGPWYGQFSWNIKKDMAGSSFLTAGCHAVDGMRWFKRGVEVTEVTSYSTRGNGKPFDVYEYDPTQVLLCKFADGSIGKAASVVECKMPYIFDIHLYGTKGTIRNNQIYTDKMKGQTNFASIPTIMPDSGDVSHHPFAGQMAHFLECIENNKESHCNLEDAAKTHEICFAAGISAEQGGKPVKLPLT